MTQVLILRLQLLEVMKTSTHILSSSKHTTASLILPTQHTIVTQIKSSCATDSDSSLVREVKCTIYNDLESRCTGDKLTNFLLECCVADPRFNSLSWLEEDQREEVYHRVIRHVMKSYEVEASLTDIASGSNTNQSADASSAAG